MFRFGEYGASLGPDSIILPESIIIPLRDSGIDLSLAAKDLDASGTPNAVNVRIDGRGVGTERNLTQIGTPYGNVDDQVIVNIYPFQRSNLNTVLVRLRSQTWDRFDGSTWKTLVGNSTGTPNDRWNVTVFGNKLIGANGIDRLQAWDGSDSSAVDDLSADAPKAKFITRIGQRVLAASIDVAGEVDPYLVQWCALADETEWTDTLVGAGLADLLPEGTSSTADIIRGLSTVAEAGVVYRQRSIALAQLTGLGSAPFRFTTTNFNHGTESPYSIANGGPLVGDFYLGHDGLVRLFDGRNEPVPIGLPITGILRDSIYDLSKVVGAIDTQRMEYWLGIPTDGTGLIKQAWIFNIYEYLRSQKLSWRKRLFAENTTCLSFGPVPSTSDPFINEVDDFVNTVSRRVNEFANNSAREHILVGSNAGEVFFVDEDVPLLNGTWESKSFWDEAIERTIQFVYMVHNTSIPSTIELSFSLNGGLSWVQPQIFKLPISGRGSIRTRMGYRLTGSIFQFRIRMLEGLTTISEVEIVAENRGRGVS